MKIKVNLDDIIDGMEFQTDEMSSYLNKMTGQVLSILDQEFEVAEEDDESLISMYGLEEEGIEKARDILKDEKGRKYIALPSQFDIHEWEIMEKFCYSIDDKDISHSLLNAIHGAGAFRYFKDLIHKCGMQNQWYKFRDETIERIAIEWCEVNQIEFIKGKSTKPDA